MSAAEKKPLALNTRNSRVVRNDGSSGHGNDTCYFLFRFICRFCCCLRLRVWLRAFLDVTFHTKPKYLGPQIPITGDAATSWD